ncbi:TPA: hypothetical protein DCW61_02290 [Candidatus Uhrbacteria bacterium]|nr:hypothetical protein [Candidatus Uhrbacteria bacterium]
MELIRHPETEMEYWETIEFLGGFIWQSEHDLSHERISDPEGTLSKEIGSAQKISDDLVRELGEKFGVIHPKNFHPVKIGQQPPPVPEGKIYYWDWYHRMKDLTYRASYEKMICSSCPFSKGVEEMIALGGVVPCGLWRGMLYRLTQPYTCAMVASDHWTQESFEEKIQREYGNRALSDFIEKKEKLRSSLTK